MKGLLRALGREREDREALLVQRRPGSVDCLSGKLLWRCLRLLLSVSVARSLAVSRQPAVAVSHVRSSDEAVGQGLGCQ